MLKKNRNGNQIASDLPLRWGKCLDADSKEGQICSDSIKGDLGMRAKIYASLTATAVAAFAATPGMADITSAEVVGLWMDLAEETDQAVSIGSQTTAGDTMILEDYEISIVTPEGEFSANVEWIKLRETGDGSVEITMSPDATFEGDFEAEGDGASFAGHFSTDMVALVSGSVDDLRYEYSATSYSIVLDDFKADDADVVIDAEVTLSGLIGDYGLALSDDDSRKISGSFGVDSVDVNASASSAKNEGSFGMLYELSDVDLSYSGDLPTAAMLEDVMTSGFSMALAMSYGGADFDLSFADKRTSFAANGSAGNLSTDISVSPERVSYAASAKALDYTIRSSEMPIPEVQLGVGEVEFNLDVPLAQTEEPVGFSFLTAIRDLSINENIWSMFDPGQVLPRDPATVVVDISGKLRWLVDLVNIDPAADPDEIPAEAHSLSINDVTVTFGGAQLDGDGAFTFNNDNRELFGGAPQPIGKLNVGLRGGFGLMDKLTAMGLIPQDAAMGMRGMIAMFARPGDNADHFISDLAVTEEGAVMVNGQRIQ